MDTKIFCRVIIKCGLHAFHQWKPDCMWLSDNCKQQFEDNAMSPRLLIIYVPTGHLQHISEFYFSLWKHRLNVFGLLSSISVVFVFVLFSVHNYAAINANLSFFSSVEPFSKSRIIVHSLRSDSPLHRHNNNRLILNEMLF